MFDKRPSSTARDRPAYRYAPLQNDEIRVVTVEPGRSHHKITCRIGVTSLSQQMVQYTALSYTWGDGKTTCSISCDGCDLTITTHLQTALQHIRRPDRSTTLWIDQICINQRDIAERSQQVQLMRRIYSSAEGVIAWLGPEADNSDAALKFAEKLVRVAAPDYSPAIPDSGRHATDAHLFGGTGELIRADHFVSYAEGRVLPRRDHRSWRALRAFLSRPYFSRMWVIQELVMARDIEVRCGGRTIPWSYLLLVVETVYAKLPPMFFGVDVEIVRLPADRLRDVQKIKHARAEGVTPGIFELLVRHRSFVSSERLDKAFALFGLAGLDGGVDYKMGAQELYVRFMVHFVLEMSGPAGGLPENEPDFRLLTHPNEAIGVPISRRGRLMALLYAAGKSKQSLDLPSWVPDWSVSDTPFPLRSNYGSRTWVAGSSGGDHISPLELVGIEWKHDGQQHDGKPLMTLAGISSGCALKMQGKICDTVTAAGTTRVAVNKPMEGAEQQQALSAWFIENSKIFNTATRAEHKFSNLIMVTGVSPPMLDLGEYHHGKAIYEGAPLLAFTKTAAYKAAMPFELSLHDYWEGIARIAGRTVFVTERGVPGLAPCGTRKGDKLCILIGVDHPVILRPTGDGAFQLYGECHVDNSEVLYGEAIGLRLGKRSKDSLLYCDLPEETIKLV